MRNHEEVIGGRVSTIYGGVHTNSALNFDYAEKTSDGRVLLERYKFKPIAHDSRIIPKNVVYPQPVFCHVDENPKPLPHDRRLNQIIQKLRDHGITDLEDIPIVHKMVAHAMVDGKIGFGEAREINKAIRSFA